MFSSKKKFLMKVGKLKAEEEEEKQQLLVRVGEGAVSLMFWNF